MAEIPWNSAIILSRYRLPAKETGPAGIDWFNKNYAARLDNLLWLVQAVKHSKTVAKDLAGLDTVTTELNRREGWANQPCKVGLLSEIYTNFMTGAGLKKCIPINGRLNPSPISWIGREEVFVAKIQFSLHR